MFKNEWLGEFPSIKGVKQGCILCNILFNLFMNDLPGYVNNATQLFIINEQINCLMYADDVLLLSESNKV